MKKCPYCAEEIQDTAIVCRFCGRDLKPSRFVAAQTTKEHRWLRNISIAAVLGTVLICGACFALVLSTANSPEFRATQTARVADNQTAAAVAQLPTRTPQPAPSATATKRPTAGPSPTVSPSATAAPTEDRSLGMSLTEFVNHYEDLTELQRQPFLDSLPGKTIDWTGKVYDVDERGVFIDMPGSIWNGMTLLTDLPEEIAMTVQKDHRLHFTGTIDKTINFLFFYVYIVDVQIVDD